MNNSSSRRTKANEIHIAPLLKWLLLAFFISSCGLIFVYVKNQQHFLGGQTREIERDIREARAHNELLVARISSLSSRAELRRKLDQGLIALRPIQDNSIARMMPPATAEPDTLVRTAANERYTP